MPEQQNSNNFYHLSAQVSDTFFSYKKPSDGKAYAFVYIKIYDNRLSLHFKRFVTADNTLELVCHLHDAKAYDIARYLEGMMARRRDAYMNNQPYATDECIKVPCTSMRNSTEVPVGTLIIDTEMVEGVPRLRITYTDIEKNDAIEVVFNKRVPSGTIEMNQANDIRIDYADVSAYKFVTILKELLDPSISIMYRLNDALLGTVVKFISRCFTKNENRPMGGGRSDWNQGSSRNSYYNKSGGQGNSNPNRGNEWPEDDVM